METVAAAVVVLCSIGISIVLARLAMQELFRATRIERSRRMNE